MKRHGTDDNSPASVIQGQRTITAQLNKAIAAMHHIDEMFQWLAYAIVHTFDIPVTQWWSLRAMQTSQYASQLRAMFYQDTSIPQYILANDRVAAMVEQLS